MRKLLLVGLMAIMSLTNAFAQVSGKVVDADTKEGLPGATVVVKGTQNGTTKNKKQNITNNR